MGPIHPQQGYWYIKHEMVCEVRKPGWEDFFPTNTGLANILGRTDLDFEILYFLYGLEWSQILNWTLLVAGIGPIALNRVNRAHWPTKGNM